MNLKPHRKYAHAWAIVRVELDELKCAEHTSVRDWTFINVPKVIVDSESAAQAEVERLNRMNADKGCVYLCLLSRLIEGG